MPPPTLAPTSPAPSTIAAPAAPPRATDDEILGIIAPRKNPPRNAAQLEFDFDAAYSSHDVIPSEASALAASGPAQPGRADAQSKNLSSDDRADSPAAHASILEPAHLRATFDANPELRSAWRDASAYREAFPTPQAAREATALLADVNHMDALFFSHRPEDHAALARAIANMDPAAFTLLAQAMQSIAACSRTAAVFSDALAARPIIPSEASAAPPVAQAFLPVPQVATSAISPHMQPHANASHNAPYRASSHDESSTQPRDTQAQPRMPVLPDAANQAHPQSAANESQLAFLHAANAAAVEGVVAAIEAQVERLLPEGVAKNARTRVVGEIYRELDSSLRSNPQFAAQLRDAFRSGSLDDGHQRAIVSLLTGRARQALPGVAKRVLSEWTSTIVSAANERRTRQRTAERRIDIAGSSGAGNDGRKSMSPRDLDYARLTDADILNL
jgi:hypothetical protein